MRGAGQQIKVGGQRIALPDLQGPVNFRIPGARMSAKRPGQLITVAVTDYQGIS